MPAISLPSLSTADTKARVGRRRRFFGRIDPVDRRQDRVGARRDGKPGDLRHCDRSAVTAVPAASDGTRLGGGAVPVVDPILERDEEGAQRRSRAVPVARVDAWSGRRIDPRPAAMLGPGDQIGARILGQRQVAPQA
jgi:hypothetical protein